MPPPLPEVPPSGLLEVTVTPNPAPWTNQPVEGCARPNTWLYQQVLRNTGTLTLTVSDRIDYMNGARVSTRRDVAIILAPGAERTITTRWCTGNAWEQRVRTDFIGEDEAGNRIDLTGPTVRLLRRPR
jgi:hypothetical protein